MKFFFVKEKVAESLISVEHTPTTSMLADPLTKDLPICVLQEHITCNTPKICPDSFITCLGYNKSKSIFFSE